MCVCLCLCLCAMHYSRDCVRILTSPPPPGKHTHTQRDCVAAEVARVRWEEEAARMRQLREIDEARRQVLILRVLI